MRSDRRETPSSLRMRRELGTGKGCFILGKSDIEFWGTVSVDPCHDFITPLLGICFIIRELMMLSFLMKSPAVISSKKRSPLAGYLMAHT